LTLEETIRVCIYLRSQLGLLGARLPCGRGVDDIEIPHVCYLTEFGRQTKVGPPETCDPSRPAFQGHSRSSEPT